MAPGPTLTTCTTDEEFGEHVLEYTHPDFRSKVKSGQQVVVAGYGFGIGSSREVAVNAIKGNQPLIHHPTTKTHANIPIQAPVSKQ